LPLTATTADGERLAAWYAPAAPGRATVLYFHGNGGGLVDRVDRFARLAEAGLGLFAVAWRGYPGSTGRPSEHGLNLDADAAYARLRGLGVPPGRIVVYGESLGSALAVALAGRHAVAGVVIEAGFTSLPDVARRSYWMFPVGLLVTDQFRSDRRIGGVLSPLLMLHGDNDDITPIHLAERLFAMANPPKEFIRVRGGGHLVLAGEFPRVIAWIDKVAR
jgi:fermentation-respiration switch protein FrsA (DUF1100 family)